MTIRTGSDGSGSGEGGVPETVYPFHFAAFTNDTIAVSNLAASPTYLTNITLASTSSPEFELITGVDGELWIKNISDKTFSMQGSATYQTNQGAGGAASYYLWSERTDDDGLTFTENTFSLRTSEVRNNSDNSQTKSSAVGSWAPNEAIRWAMYRTGGAVNLDSPSTTVNGVSPIEGFSFYWQLIAVN